MGARHSLLDEANLENELRSILDKLQQVGTKAEDRFLEIGNDLRNLHANAGQLAELNSKSASLTRDVTGDGFLSFIDKLSSGALDSVNTSRDRYSTSLDKISDIKDIMSGLPVKNKKLERTGKKLRVIGMNIRVESSRSADAQEMFAAFVEDLDVLVSRTSDITDDIRQSVNKANSIQEKVRNRISTGRLELEELVNEVNTSLEHTAARSTDLLSVSAESLNKSARHSEKIQKLISDIVTAIQMDDIIRQRIEHISEALNSILTDLQSEDCVGESRTNLLGAAHSVLVLQSAQLRSTTKELEKAHTVLLKSFLQIGVEIGQLVVDSDSNQMNQSNNALANQFDQLNSVMNTMNCAFEKVADLDALTKQASVETSESSSSLALFIENIVDISIDMQLQALNAIIKSVRLGDGGRTLQVLSQEVTVLSEGTSSFVKDVVKDLERINKASKGLTEGIISGDHESDNLNLSTDFRADIRQVNQGCESYKDILSEIFDKSNTLEIAINKAEKSLEFLPEFIDNMKQGLDALDRVIQSLEIYDTGSMSKTDGYSDLSDSYTMASERDVHDSLTSDSEGKSNRRIGESSPDGTPVKAGSNNEEFEDNIELF